MPPNPARFHWRNGIPLLVLLVIVISVAVGVHNSAGEHYESTSATDWLHNFIYLADAVLWSVGPTLLVAALLLYYRRARPVAVIAIALCAVRILIEIFSHFVLDDSRIAAGTAFHIVSNESALACDYFVLVMLCLLPQLSKTARAVQAVAVNAFILAFLLQSLVAFRAPFVSTTPLLIARGVIVAIGLVSIPAVAYCSLFHRVSAPHRPPIDAAPAISLTCPRCQSPQSIPTNGGHCANCQLQIFIALDEGRCQNCRYPLRGLTSPNCPECGTPIASSNALSSA